MKKLFEKLFIKKTDSIILQLFRYGMAGGTAALVDIGSYSFFCYALSIHYAISTTASFTLGTLTNFFISNIFVFDRKSLSLLRTCIRHYLSSLGGLATNYLVLVVLIESAVMPNLFISKLIATACAFFVNFTLMRLYAFNQNISLARKIRSVKDRLTGAW